MRLSNLRKLSSIGMVASCFGAVSLPGMLHKVNGIMKQEEYLQVFHLYLHHTSTARRVKFGQNWVFQHDSDPKHIKTWF